MGDGPPDKNLQFNFLWLNLVTILHSHLALSNFDFVRIFLSSYFLSRISLLSFTVRSSY